jgi:hypothetical protein
LKIIYKITYPNDKIYIGKDLTNTFRYFGSPNSKLLESDFTDEEKKDFTIRREILWQSNDATDGEVNEKEVELILKYKSNNPKIGYNRSQNSKKNENKLWLVLCCFLNQSFPPVLAFYLFLSLERYLSALLTMSND